MRAFNVVNVDEAFPLLLDYVTSEGVKSDSRNGPVLAIDTPVGVTYQKPTQRFILSPLRKQNPFFLVMEALWILDGRDDVAWLSRFNEQMALYSDDGVRFHAAYGYRLGNDLTKVIEVLKRDPTSRRAVAQIWDKNLDLGTDSKDIPCNMLLCFLLRGGALDLTVYNRSNDLLFGLSNANAVQFSVILEFIASALGVPTGSYTQITNNLHVYLGTPNLELYRSIPIQDSMQEDGIPLVRNFALFRLELERFMWDSEKNVLLFQSDHKEPFFKDVAVPLFNVWMLRKYLGGTLEQQKTWANKILDVNIRQLVYQWIDK